MLIGDEKDKALREYARVLKPGGLLLTQNIFLRRDDMKTCWENIAMFMGMFDFFNNHKQDIGYIAMASVNQETEGKQQ